MRLRPWGKGERGFIVQQSVTTYSFFKEFPREIFRGIFGDTIHEGSSAYLQPQSLRVLGNPDWIRSQIEKESKVDRPMFTVDRAVDRTQTKSNLLSVG